MSKVFIVTDEEIAAYALAHQQTLLDAMQKVALEHPEASVEELLVYARQELVIQTTKHDWDYNAENQIEATNGPELAIEALVPELEPEPEVVEEPEYTQFVVEEYAPYAPDPAFAVEESAEEDALVEDEDPYDSEEDEPTVEDGDDQSLAFRRRKYQGLFHEASKLDET